jgi:hypothetical protein
MDKTVNNQYLQAFFKLLLLAALIHCPILITQTLVHQDLSIINVVNVLGLNWLLPQAGQGTISNLLSLAFWLFLYLVVLKKGNKPRP